MLEFQKQILTELVDEDALLVLAPGLGLFKLLCSFIQLYCKGNHLVLVLNTTQKQDTAIGEHLTAAGIDPEHRMRVIEYDTPADTRSAMYKESGVFSITSRILAVDMLLKRVPAAMISGIIVYNAHRIRPNSMEELILRIYREENEQGFIKAMSDQPEAFTTGFAPLQNTLKSLQLRKVHLWPRFQVLVSDNLAASSGDVVELRQPMTQSMDDIQQGLVECMEATLAEIKRANLMVDVEEFTIENSFFKSFHTIVRRQLDPVWHRVSPATKQLVSDLGVLQELLNYLTQYDCVSFYSFIETIIASNTSKDGRQVRQSQWLFLDAADKAISTARKRFYLKPNDPGYDPQNAPNIQLVLEEQPKWSLLREIMEEIDHAAATMQQNAPVLIMVREKRTSSQLKDYLSHMQPDTKEQTTPLLQRTAQRFFHYRKNMVSMQTGAQEAANAAQQKQQQQEQAAKSFSQRGVPPPNKRRRVRGGSVAAASPSSRQTITEAFKQNAMENVKILDTPVGPETEASVFGENDILPEFKQVPVGSLVTIQCYEDDMDEQVLEDIEPRFIVMYDPDPAFVRRVEVYRALRPHMDIRVYFMVYDNSVEEQNYLSTIRREKEAFEKLIREKSIMAIPMPQKATQQQDHFIRAVSSRIAGGQLKTSGPPAVVVDMREFRSSLPPILYGAGIKIIPCTLQVGDYILSPNMCVERKSVSDLISSLNSGRLYTQCESMTQYYKSPILLIEFDEGKSFSLTTLTDIKENITATDLSSKLVLLTLTFPRVKIIWSSSPHETAKIFQELKRTEDEPDADKAVLVGAENADEAESTHNMKPQDILRSMPGVTSRNYRIIINAVENLEQLCAMSKEDIQKLIGEEPGRKLHAFIHYNPGTGGQEK